MNKGQTLVILAIISTSTSLNNWKLDHKFDRKDEGFSLILFFNFKGCVEKIELQS